MEYVSKYLGYKDNDNGKVFKDIPLKDEIAKEKWCNLDFYLPNQVEINSEASPEVNLFQPQLLKVLRHLEKDTKYMLHCDPKFYSGNIPDYTFTTDHIQKSNEYTTVIVGECKTYDTLKTEGIPDLVNYCAEIMIAQLQSKRSFVFGFCTNLKKIQFLLAEDTGTDMFRSYDIP